MNNQANIVPQPGEISFSGGDILLKIPISVDYSNDPEIRNIVEICAVILRQIDAPELLLTGSGIYLNRKSGICLVLNKIDCEIDGAYRLAVGAESVRIESSTKTGLFYGMQSLIQLLMSSDKNGNEIKLREIEINDSPRFGWRGMHLDVSRHFFPVEFVKKCIDLLAFHKMNMFHWHLTDDQGWRIEIKKYPRLTEVGAWRNNPGGERYGGFYTQDEIREVVRYASERYVTIIPEIELPGHASAALAAYPEFSCTGSPIEVETRWGIFDDVYCAGKEATYEFLNNVLEEVASLFPGPYLHIGGDECPRDRWLSHELCIKRIKDMNLSNADGLQSYFISRIAKFLKSLGKQMVGWDEILDGGAPEGAVIMAWRDIAKSIEAARAGHDVVMTPLPYCYFDHYQGKTGEPKAIGGYTPLEKVYEFNPVPEELSANLSRHVLGAQANVWTEYMPGEKHVEYMTYPRLCALAEVLWTPSYQRNFRAFTERLKQHLKILDSWQVNYHRPSDDWH
jgi:hexosaminidase